ncbi:MAG: glutamate-1-semialdehyde 2,1-aminomutase [Fimbriimonadaceae bacterium]|nr:glutamate-1-semialdehyde 2,1-aminomutase [Fimbriimonadaceae bacterium]
MSVNPVSEALFERAGAVLPGGVNSPVRAFRGVGGSPRFFQRGHGAWLVDADGHELLDYVASWGPLLLGHAHPEVTAAVQQAVAAGTSFGAPSAGEVELAEQIVATIDSVEVARLVCSGTEAAMAALRLARGATGRDRCLKFDGCYHGHADSLLVAAGSGVATFGLPDSPGVPAALAALTHSLPFGDLAAVEAALTAYPGEVACVIVEPVAGNMGVVDPPREFLVGLRELCDRHGALLVFDEVMTGYRVALGGAQARAGVTPDLTVLGKVIGGGLPLAAYGGRAELMRQIAPAGPIYQAGTLSGNPVAVAAGNAMLRVLRREDPYPALNAATARLAAGLREAAAAVGVPVQVNHAGAMLTLFFCDAPVTDYATAKRSATARFGSFFHAMLERGVYLPPSQFEAWFPGTAHTAELIDQTIAAARDALAWCVANDWPRP